MTCGDDVEEASPKAWTTSAGYDEQISSDVEGFFDARSKDVLPAFR